MAANKDRIEGFANDVINQYKEKGITNKNVEELTDLVFLYIENDPKLYDKYSNLKSALGENSDLLNQTLGKRIKDEFGVENSGINNNPQSTLIKSYTKHK